MRILIAEDDYTSRTVLAGVLKKEGHEVTVTTNGAEAWQALINRAKVKDFDQGRAVALDQAAVEKVKAAGAKDVFLTDEQQPGHRQP